MVSKKIKCMILELLGYDDISELTLDLSFFDDLLVEPDDFADLISAVEEEFEIELSDRDVDKIDVIDDLVKAVKRAV